MGNCSKLNYPSDKKFKYSSDFGNTPALYEKCQITPEQYVCQVDPVIRAKIIPPICITLKFGRAFWKVLEASDGATYSKLLLASTQIACDNDSMAFEQRLGMAYEMALK